MQTFSRDDLSPTPPPIERSPVCIYCGQSGFCQVSFNYQPQSRWRYQQRVIPPEEGIWRLFQECKIARGNADVVARGDLMQQITGVSVSGDFLMIDRANTHRLRVHDTGCL